jgi:hypothetical protein
MGLADELEEPIQMAAQFDLSRFSNVPRALVQPARATGSTPKKEENIMDLKALQEKYPDLVAQVEASAREGMIVKAAHETAVTEAKSGGAKEGRDSVLALHGALYGEEAGKQFAAVVESGVTAEQAKALGVTAEGGGTTQQRMLDAITTASAEGVRPAQGKAAEGKGIDTAGIYASRRQAMAGK